MSRRIARHVARLRPEDLPRETVRATRRALLDSVGVMLAATGLAPESVPFREQALAQSRAGRARLLGTAERIGAEGAAFGNGALAHALDFGDTFDAGPAHPSAALVPALLSLAEDKGGLDAGQFITAMAAGSDLACRLSIAPMRRYEEGGWYPPPLVGMVGAAVAAAKLIGLDEEGILSAMGLVLCLASFPGEIKHDPRTQLRAVREAFAARGAVTAALLASRGVRGFEAPLEGKAGFFALYGGGFDEAALLGNLGERFLGDEVSFKPWPACRGTHAYIEAALLLRERLASRLEEIQAVEVEIGPVQTMLVEPLPEKARPRTAIDAKFSIPFTVAMALVRGSVTLESFRPEAMEDSHVLDLAARVTARPSARWGSFGPASGAVEIVLASGERQALDVPLAAGHPDRPMGDEALIEKFVACAAAAARPLSKSIAETLAYDILFLSPDASATAWLDRI